MYSILFELDTCKAQVSRIWAKGFMLMIVCVLPDLAWLPLIGLGRKSWCIIIYYYYIL